MIPLLFIPGGPGFSAAAESESLRAPLAQAGYAAEFWREPWRIHSEATSYPAYMAGLSEAFQAYRDHELTIVAHSFAAQPVCSLIRNLGWSAARIFLIAPVFNVHDLHLRLFSLAAKDFDQQGRRSEADRLRQLSAESTHLFDDAAQAALVLAASDEHLLRHYWADEDAFTRFITAISAPGAEFRPDAFFGVLSGFSAAGDGYVQGEAGTGAAVTVLLGDADPVVDPTDAVGVAQRLFTSPSIIRVRGAGHWLHLERPDQLIDALVTLDGPTH